MLSTSEVQALETQINGINTDVFIVDISLKRGSQSVLSIKIDTEEGITLAACSEISRKLGRWLDEQETFDFSYRLEVSSPGIGAPLHLNAQYKRHVGRALRIILNTGNTLEGKLLAVEPDCIRIHPLETLKRNKKQKAKSIAKDQEAQDIPFAEIKESKVIVLF